MSAAVTRGKAPGPIRAWLRRRGYHLLFAAALFSLLALVLWWSVFIRESIKLRHDLQYASMQKTATIIALQLGHNWQQEPTVGKLDLDDRLEVVKEDAKQLEHAVPLAPAWPQYSIVPRKEVVAQLEDKAARQFLMVTGESSTLLLVVLVCFFMLWYMMRLERRATRQLHEFWGRVTHELKTPITGIKAFLQTLQQHEFSKEELAPLLKLALGEVERQEMLAENLLLGQRLESRDSVIGLRSIRVGQFVRDFIDEHRIILPDENLKFVLSCPEDTEARADPDGLRVILENLTDNALKYGGEHPELTYEIARDDGRVTITISDRGIGFNPANANLLFDAYERLSEDQPRGKHGTGMGLYLSRQLARKMGGDLIARSEGANTGAQFLITLRSISRA